MPSAHAASRALAHFQRDLARPGLLQSLRWDEWLAMPPMRSAVAFAEQPVAARYERNGFSWDIHGRLFLPQREAEPDLAIVMFHGGAGSEWEVTETPDGRPGIARVAAALGVKVLAITYTGHYPPEDIWQMPVDARQPVYLLDRDLPAAEIGRRNLACTFDTILQGAGQLIDEYLPGCRLLAFGHSTGGPMAAFLYRATRRSRVIGLLGWASGGPSGWRLTWRRETSAEPDKSEDAPLDGFVRRSAATFARQRFVDVPELTPWGGVDEYNAWGDRYKSQMKTALLAHQHQPNPEVLEEYPALTGLPREEFFSPLDEPDQAWLRDRGVLLLVGELDRGHWVEGGPERNRETWMARQYAARGSRPRIVLVPKYRHFGFVALHNERIVHTWLAAYAAGYFK